MKIEALHFLKYCTSNDIHIIRYISPY
jgi:hypothetical protein